MRSLKALVGAALVCTVLVTGGCGDDNPVDGGNGEMDLASFTAMHNSTTPNPPALPPAIHVQFGVQSYPPDTSSDYPSPLLFEDHDFTEAGQSLTRTVATSDVATVAARLVDGQDESIYYQIAWDGGGASGSGSNESHGLTYASGLDRSGPDLAGYAVTSIRIDVEELSVTQQQDGRWAMRATVTGTIRGHKR